MCSYHFPVCPLDHELVLQDNEVALALLELHERLETRTQGIEQVAIAYFGLVTRENSYPLQARDDTSALLFVGKLTELLRPIDECPTPRMVSFSPLRETMDVLLRRLCGSGGVLRDFSPCKPILQPWLRVGIEQADRDKRIHILWETGVAHGPSHHCLRLRNLIGFAEWKRAPVWESDQGEPVDD